MSLYSILFLVSFLLLLFILYLTIKSYIDIHYAMVWIIWSILLIIISVFPSTVDWLTHLLKIQYPSNTIFLVFIFLSYCLSLYLYLIITKHNKQIQNLNYEVAALKKKIEELEKEKEND
ncbi:MAG: DUF2304 domain-containing protein [Erysipelotrichaceae bacterium]|nr:DUF2304 domain-containing protein [Erysipelotrichaceae bacterium]